MSAERACPLTAANSVSIQKQAGLVEIKAYESIDCRHWLQCRQ